MGRLVRKGLDYFSLDTTWETAVKLVKAKYGTLEATGFLTELWASIYRENYYRIWDEETELLFADEIKRPVEWVHEIIEYCLTKGIFDRKILDAKGVLTSHGIQKRYFKIALAISRTGIDYINGITYPDFMSKSNPPGKADNPPGKADNPPGKADNPPGYDHNRIELNSIELNSNTASKHISTDPASTPSPSACLPFDIQELKSRIEKAPFASSFSDSDYEQFAARLQSATLDLGFVDYCINRVAGDKKTTKPAGLFKAGMLSYDAWVKEYRKTAPEHFEQVELAPILEACTCGGEVKLNRRAGEALCLACGKFWEYSKSWEQWEELKPEKKTG